MKPPFRVAEIEKYGRLVVGLFAYDQLAAWIEPRHVYAMVDEMVDLAEQIERQRRDKKESVPGDGMAKTTKDIK